MLVAVISINLLISAFCFFVAWKIWQIRRVLLRVENTLLSLERCSDRVLRKTPNCFSYQQAKVYQLRERYRRLELQLQQIQQLVGALTLTWRLLRRPSRP